MIVFGSVIILIIISMVLLGISSRMNAFRTNQAELTFVKSEACLEEALIQLSRNNDYTGDIYNFDELTCNVMVDGSGDERTLHVDTEDGEYFRNFVVLVQVTPLFAILDFSY